MPASEAHPGDVARGACGRDTVRPCDSTGLAGVISPFRVVLLNLRGGRRLSRASLGLRVGLTLCRSMMSFAMHAGGPLSRKGVPTRRGDVRRSVRRGEEEDSRDATSARPASCASKKSSPPVMDDQTEGKQRKDRRSDARKERRTRGDIVLYEQDGRRGTPGRGETVVSKGSRRLSPTRAHKKYSLGFPNKPPPPSPALPGR